MKSMRAFIVLFILIPQFVWALCVNEEKANLRQGPGMKQPKTWEVIRYTPLKLMGKQSGFYKVQDQDGKTHWVREDLVTSNFKCAAIKTEFANLRKGPGLNFPKTKVGRGDKYLSFRVLQTKGRWVKLEDLDGDTMWAAIENLWIQ